MGPSAKAALVTSVNDPSRSLTNSLSAVSGRDGLAVLSDDMSRAEIQAVALDAAPADIEVLVAVVVQVAGDYSARTLLDRRDARGFGGLDKDHVAVVAEETVGVVRLLGEVDVLVAVAVVVEDGDARAVVGDAVRAAQDFPGDVGEGGYGALRFGCRSRVGFGGAGEGRDEQGEQ